MENRMKKTLLGITMIIALAGQARAQSITVFTGPDFRGEQQSFSREASRLSDVGWDCNVPTLDPVY